MTRESAITAAIVGELIPELEYASPVLVERLDRGDPLVGRTSPADVGFDTGSLDSVLLELFKALVPYVKTVMGWGILIVVQDWLLSERGARQHLELVARLQSLVAENERLRLTVERIAELLGKRYGVVVPTAEVVDSIATAVGRLEQTDDPPADIER